MAWIRVALLQFTLLVGCSSRGRTDDTHQQLATAPDASALPSAEVSPVPSPPPLVGLDGNLTRLSTTVPQSNLRIFGRSLRTWIYDSPKSGANRIGTIRIGMALRASDSAVGKEGCPGGWYSVVPGGFVCAGDDATTDSNDAAVRAVADYPADITKTLPYFYGTVRRPGPIYRRLPTQEELRRYEPELDRRMESWLTAPGEIGAGYGQQLWLDSNANATNPRTAWENRTSEEPPWFLAAGATPPLLPGRMPLSDPIILGQMQPRVGYSILKTLLWNGRRYGIATDLAIVATDRLRPIQGSTFHGFRIPEEIDFPFAIIRTSGARHYRFDREKNQLVPGEPAEYRGAVRLTGKQNFFRGRLHFETANGTWLSDSDASRLDPAKRMPAWGKAGEKWIDVNITKQTLVLFEGTKAVYATLVSTGEDGLKDAATSRATQRGIFRIHTKFVTATMDSDEVGEEFELRDVPYVQYFEKGYALHGAYWHDRFGVPKSHGCINLAPEDARRIFFWTEPALPAGWYGVLKPLRGTVLFVHP